jgi:hypothetical protein
MARDGFGLNYTQGFPLATIVLPRPETDVSSLIASELPRIEKPTSAVGACWEGAVSSRFGIGVIADSSYDRSFALCQSAQFNVLIVIPNCALFPLLIYECLECRCFISWKKQ